MINNNEQLNSLVRSVLKIAGGALIAHGLTKYAAVLNTEDAVGAIVTITGAVMSYFKHKQLANNQPK